MYADYMNEENNFEYELEEKDLEKKLLLDVKYENDEDIGSERYQQINNKENDIYFSVCNLYDCPEDAIIGRDLFDVNDYIRALNKGIELAKKGYTSVEGKYIKIEEDE